ncbi:interferon gamma [Lissotriton helveticus]
MALRASVIFQCVLIFFCIGCCASYPLNLQTLKADCAALMEHFMSTNPNGANDGAIFQKKLDTWKEKSVKQLFLSLIVDKYLKMFGSLKIGSVQKHIDNIREELSKASKDVLKPEEQLMKDLLDLKSLEMGDIKVQQKAAMELYSIFQEINLLNNPTIKRKRNKERRRRGSKN